MKYLNWLLAFLVLTAFVLMAVNLATTSVVEAVNLPNPHRIPANWTMIGAPLLFLGIIVVIGFFANRGK